MGSWEGCGRNVCLSFSGQGTASYNCSCGGLLLKSCWLRDLWTSSGRNALEKKIFLA